MALWTAEQLARVREIIRRHHEAIGVAVFGPEMFPGLKDQLAELGLEIQDAPDLLEDPLGYGRLLGRLEDPGLANQAPATVARMLKTNPGPPLGRAEKAAVAMAARHAGQYVTGLGDRVTAAVMGAVTGEESQLAPDTMREVIASATALNRAKRESVARLKSDLGHAADDWSRDWQRVATTEVNNAQQEGNAIALEDDHGEGVLVSKIPRPDACPDCVRLYLTAGQGSDPKVFTLSELRENGTNVGRKRVDWQPVVESVHPWCGCQLVRLPAGMVWKDGEMVPKAMANKSWGWDDLDDLIKAAHHKYLRRLPTGKPKPKYRYIYSVNSKWHGSDPSVGEKVRVSHDGQDGHYTVEEKLADGRVRAVHDETGDERFFHPEALHDLFHAEHREEVQETHGKLQDVHDQAKRTGSAKQKRNAESALERFQAMYDLVDEHKADRIPASTEGRWRVYQSILDAAGISDHDSSAADHRYLDARRQGTTRKLPALEWGGLDTFNEGTDRKKKLTSVFHGFEHALRQQKVKTWRDLKPILSMLREVPGFYNAQLPREVIERHGQEGVRGAQLGRMTPESMGSEVPERHEPEDEGDVSFDFGEAAEPEDDDDDAFDFGANVEPGERLAASLPILHDLSKAENSAPLPDSWGVIYAHPNPDNTRKRCNNCMMWVDNGKLNGNKCVIHKKSLNVLYNHICGYHVFGQPMDRWMDHPGIDPVDPKHSGFERVPSGTACDNCKFYEGERKPNARGHCLAMRHRPSVEARGCCSRWEGGNGTTLAKGLTGSPFKLHYRTTFQGFPISVENRRGSYRTWKNPKTGEEGRSKMHHPYGYIRGTHGADDDEIDVFLGPDEDVPNVYVVHQLKRTGDDSFGGHDEDKVMLGFRTKGEAKRAYLKHYDHPGYFGSMSILTVARFRKTLGHNDGKRLRLIRAFTTVEDDAFEKAWVEMEVGAFEKAERDTPTPAASRPLEEATHEALDHFHEQKAKGDTPGIKRALTHLYDVEVDHAVVIATALKNGGLTDEEYDSIHEPDFGPVDEFRAIDWAKDAWQPPVSESEAWKKYVLRKADLFLDLRKAPFYRDALDIATMGPPRTQRSTALPPTIVQHTDDTPKVRRRSPRPFDVTGLADAMGITPEGKAARKKRRKLHAADRTYWAQRYRESYDVFQIIERPHGQPGDIATAEGWTPQTLKENDKGARNLIDEKRATMKEMAERKRGHRVSEARIEHFRRRGPA